jgi:REP element-mobilizing transposase RayT
MTTRWRPDFDPGHLYFVTTTAAERKHIFRRDGVKRVLVDSLYYFSLMLQVALYAFVIMPNHMQAIIQCPQGCPPKDWTRAFKVGSARLIVRQLTYTHNNPLQPHWRLVEAQEDYEWSSARFYLRDEPTLVPAQDVRELHG